MGALLMIDVCPLNQYQKLQEFQEWKQEWKKGMREEVGMRRETKEKQKGSEEIHPTYKTKRRRNQKQQG